VLLHFQSYVHILADQRFGSGRLSGLRFGAGSPVGVGIGLGFDFRNSDGPFRFGLRELNVSRLLVGDPLRLVHRWLRSDILVAAGFPSGQGNTFSGVSAKSIIELAHYWTGGRGASATSGFHRGVRVIDLRNSCYYGGGASGFAWNRRDFSNGGYNHRRGGRGLPIMRVIRR